MSVSSISETVKIRLWGRAAGRCEYEGCNCPLWLDPITKSEFNSAYLAHIVADSPDGPRGDFSLSRELSGEISNLMLLCDVHHRLIDKKDVAGHPVDRLIAMKRAHEARIERLTAISSERQSHVLLYGANIGEQNSKVSYEAAAEAMAPIWYPAEASAISLGLLNSSFEDKDAEFWSIESQQLTTLFSKEVRSRLRNDNVSHLSVFAFAPQPLLIKLGSLLSDIPAADVYQLHREPPGWKWGPEPTEFEFLIDEPRSIHGEPTLILALSASINDERIFANLGAQATIWRVTIANPNNDFLKSREQAAAFRTQMRHLMNRIKARHGESATVHVFPAMPVALAVEFGRILMPKADLPLRVYDQNHKLGGFSFAIEINPRVLFKGEPC